MIVGIPGTGIGGLFCLLSALWLPIRGLLRHARGRVSRFPSALRQAALAVGILVGLWLTGELLGMVVFRALPGAGPQAIVAGMVTPGTTNLFRAASLMIGAVTLGVVLMTVRVARFVVRRAAASSNSQPR
jgi:hypothetical protein